MVQSFRNKLGMSCRLLVAGEHRSTSTKKALKPNRYQGWGNSILENVPTPTPVVHGKSPPHPQFGPQSRPGM
jgi:hypothetical protein